MSGERLYESAAVWDQQLQVGQRNLIQAICDHWPDGVCSVLDVGCGDGKITHALAERTGAFFHGFDGSKEALSRLRLPSTHGDVRRLPFDDKAFDLVMTTDVFEHLPDDVEQEAWHELFRVARDWVFFAVPFREELLDATARCWACGNHYHVNWHERAYDFSDLIRCAPASWVLSGIVLSGEPWSSMLPPETTYRRTELDEWSGWSEAVCSACGAPGKEADPPQVLPQDVARALALFIYDQATSSRFVRSHSEILVAFSRTGKQLVTRGAGAIESNVCPAASWSAVQGLGASLDPYPQVAKMVPAVDGGFVAQFPAYVGANRSLIFVGGDNASEPVPILVEDGYGLLFDGEVAVSRQSVAEIEFPREIRAGYYGLLVRIPAAQPFASITLPGSPLVRWVRPVGELCGYFSVEGTRAKVQVPRLLWLDELALRPRVFSHGGDASIVHAIAHRERERDKCATELAACTREYEAVSRDLQHATQECERLATELSARTQEYEAVSLDRGFAMRECERLAAELAACRHEHEVVSREQDQLRHLHSAQQAALAQLRQRGEVRAGQWIRCKLSLHRKSKET